MVGACGDAELGRGRPSRERERNSEACYEKPGALSQALNNAWSAHQRCAGPRGQHHHNDVGEIVQRHRGQAEGDELERGEIGDADLDHAIGLMTKHRALEDTINRAQHYGAMAVDALALFPASAMKTALEQVVAFCLARSH